MTGDTFRQFSLRVAIVFGNVQFLGPNWLLEHLFPISEARIGVSWGEIM